MPNLCVSLPKTASWVNSSHPVAHVQSYLPDYPKPNRDAFTSTRYVLVDEQARTLSHFNGLDRRMLVYDRSSPKKFRKKYATNRGVASKTIM